MFFYCRCLYYQFEDGLMLLHHMTTISMVTGCLYLEHSGAEIVATIFGSEITTIFFNVSYITEWCNSYCNTMLRSRYCYISLQVSYIENMFCLLTMYIFSCDMTTDATPRGSKMHTFRQVICFDTEWKIN